MNAIRPYLNTYPTIADRVYIDPQSTIIGDVELADDVSIWPAAVLRGDVNFIKVGERTNIQDGSVIHVSHHSPYNQAGLPTLIGADITIGHGAIIHACTLHNACLIGMGARVLDGAVVHSHAFIGAGAVVPPNKIVGEGELWLGNPARKARLLSPQEIEAIYYSAAHYVKIKNNYLLNNSTDNLSLK